MKRLVVAVIAVPALALLTFVPAGASSGSAPAPGASPFDAYIASGDASCLELTVNVAGYSFIVEPDVRLPRATASLSEGETGAVAAPADPGDSVDALPGLLFPREEGQIASGIDSGLAQLPIPFPVDVGNSVLQVANPFNPHLEYPIEHASAAYPNPAAPGDQEATYLGAGNASVTDPSGLFSVDGASGDAKAGATYATADAGSGVALSVPMLGVAIERVAAHAAAQTTATAVSDDVSCTLHGVTIAPPGAGHTLRIGTLEATLHTERRVGAPSATTTRTLQLADVTMDGTDLAPAGGAITVPPQLQNIPLNQPPPPCSVLPSPQCQTVPASPISLQSIQLGGTTHSEQLAPSGNQETSTLTAATVTLQSTAPVPASIPSGPPACLSGNPPPIAECLPNLTPSSPGSSLPITSAPTTYTVSLASLDSSAYGFLALPSVVSPVPPLSGLGNLGGVGFGAAGGATGPGGTGTPSTHPTATTIDIPAVAGAIRWPVVALAGLLEALLLATLYMRRRAALRTGMAARPPAGFIDLP